MTNNTHGQAHTGRTLTHHHNREEGLCAMHVAQLAGDSASQAHQPSAARAATAKFTKWQ